MYQSIDQRELHLGALYRSPPTCFWSDKVGCNQLHEHRECTLLITRTDKNVRHRALAGLFQKIILYGSPVLPLIQSVEHHVPVSTKVCGSLEERTQ
jgi:hypothetical protein